MTVMSSNRFTVTAAMMRTAKDTTIHNPPTTKKTLQNKRGRCVREYAGVHVANS